MFNSYFQLRELGKSLVGILLHTCSRIKSSHPFPPCHTKPTWCDIIGKLHTKHRAVIVQTENSYR
jgi:hypothetical protein